MKYGFISMPIHCVQKVAVAAKKVLIKGIVYAKKMLTLAR